MNNRFNWEYDDDDDDNLDDREDEMQNEDLENALKQELIGVQLEQVDILQQDVDEKIMQDAITVASRDWLWYFIFIFLNIESGYNTPQLLDQKVNAAKLI